MGLTANLIHVLVHQAGFHYSSLLPFFTVIILKVLFLLILPLYGSFGVPCRVSGLVL